jgi:hypothetical protein
MPFLVFVCKAICNLCLTKYNRDKLVEYGLVTLLVEALCQYAEITYTKFAKTGTSIMEAQEEAAETAKFLSPLLKSLLMLCKTDLVVRKELVLVPKFVACLVRMMNYEPIKIKIHCLKLCQMLIEPVKQNGNQTYNSGTKQSVVTQTVHNQFTEMGLINVLYPMLKSARENMKIEVLRVMNGIAKNEAARDAMFKIGAFQSILQMMRANDDESRLLSLEIVSCFLPSNNINIDALILKFNFDLLIQLFLNDKNATNPVQNSSPTATTLQQQVERTDAIRYCATHILAHLSDYSRIHCVLLQQSVMQHILEMVMKEGSQTRVLNLLKQSAGESGQLIDAGQMGITSTSFLSLLILSNLSKYRDGQTIIYRNGGVSLLVRCLKVISDIHHCQRKFSNGTQAGSVKKVTFQYPLPKEEFDLLPKVVTRTIANMSSYQECQHSMTSGKDALLDPLGKLMVNSAERTVIWNSLCTLSNLCDDITNLSVISRKEVLKQCMYHYLTQSEDSKLQSRVLRVLYKLSRDEKSQSTLEEFFRLSRIVEIVNQATQDEIRLDGLRYVVNLAHNREFCNRVVESKAIEMMVKMSLSPSEPFVLEVARGFLALAQMANSQLRSTMIRAGAVQRLIALKKTTQNDRIREWCTITLQTFN